jgi:amino acid transporter
VNQPLETGHLRKQLGTFDVFAAGVALVVASTTLVSDFVGYFTLGASFLMAILIAFAINLLLGISAADLAVAYPKAGAIYEYGRDVVSGPAGRLVGTFLGLAFIGMFVFAGAGEIAAGSFGLQALFNATGGLNWFILAMVVAATIPNLLGIRVAAGLSAVLLIAMLGIRWFFGIAGFLGFSDTGSWSSDNLNTGAAGLFDLFGNTGLLATGLTLAFWTFVGIEFACSLTEEVRDPHRAMPKGIILGLIVILGTSWLMGLGVAGSAPEGGWAETALGAAGCDGSCPQLAVGEAMFGGFGRGLMALASISATLGSMIVALAAIPRVIYGLARDGNFFGPLSKSMAWVHPKWNTPVPAIVLFAVVSTIPALFSSDVVDLVFSGAYLWILIYLAYNVLALVRRTSRSAAGGAFGGSWVMVASALGIVATLIGLYYAFKGVHGRFGGRALGVLAVAAVATALSALSPEHKATTRSVMAGEPV